MLLRAWRLAGLAAALGLMSVSAHAGQTPPSAAPQAAPGPLITYTVEQLATAPLPPAVQQQLKPLNTLKACEDLLKANYIAFNWRRVDVTTDKMNPDFARQLAALPPGEVFVVPTAQGVTINVIVGKR
jgi:hypothetical protein